ncbi:Putative membrane protein insertion efficiency factor [Candidatus Magnetaquicoccaceae bacterium FCR-1]|uniref:Membrane protein insertion efficiency factor n=1 Tax=Candidatus Magnetaquiglobus chichijimensis TaxID=3141448 RepID=A0ABQ0C9C3_9PROT
MSSIPPHALPPQTVRGTLPGIAILAFLAICHATSPAHANENPLEYHPLPAVKRAQSDPVVQWLLFPLRLYSHTISRVDGDRCPSHPNCSHYAKQAIERHGALTGLMLTIDRLIHERGEIDRAPRILAPNGTQRLLDPLAANDFWLE